jgi:membrane-associated protease RseP (regulator of RpoE activity)
VSERRYSTWQILGVLGVVLAVGAAALAGGVFLGYQWGRANGMAASLGGPARDRFAVPRPAFPPFLQPQPFSDSEPQPYLGVRFETITPELAEAEALSTDSGALIRQVIGGGPAEQAGLEVGDIVQSVDGAAVDEARTLRDHVLAHAPGDAVTLAVLRGDETLEIQVALGEELPAREQFFLPSQEFRMEPRFRFEFRCASGPCPFFEDERDGGQPSTGPIY